MVPYIRPVLWVITSELMLTGLGYLSGTSLKRASGIHFLNLTAGGLFLASAFTPFPMAKMACFAGGVVCFVPVVRDILFGKKSKI